MNAKSFAQAVHGQIELLRSGKPLDSIDQYFAEDGVMYANGELFAEGAAAARKKQEPFISSAREIVGKIVDVKLNETAEICVFRNRSSFKDADGKVHQIDGLCWQKWTDGKIAEEQYFQGDMMNEMISSGLLESPEKHKILKPLGRALRAERNMMKKIETHEPIKAQKVDLSGSVFDDVDLSGTTFTDINLSNVKFTNINMTNVRFSDINMTGVTINDANLTNMSINGMLVTDLIAAFKSKP